MRGVGVAGKALHAGAQATRADDGGGRAMWRVAWACRARRAVSTARGGGRVDRCCAWKRWRGGHRVRVESVDGWSAVVRGSTGE